MTKYILLLTIFFCALNVQGQKINSYTYKKVDTVIQYKDAEIIIYRGKKDTIYYYKMKHDINIEEVGVLIMQEDKMLPKQK